MCSELGTISVIFDILETGPDSCETMTVIWPCKGWNKYILTSQVIVRVLQQQKKEHKSATYIHWLHSKESTNLIINLQHFDERHKVFSIEQLRTGENDLCIFANHFSAFWRKSAFTFCFVVSGCFWFTKKRRSAYPVAFMIFVVTSTVSITSDFTMGMLANGPTCRKWRLHS